MKIFLLLGLAFALSACVVEERHRPYVSRYDQRDIVVYGGPRYVEPPRHQGWYKHHKHHRHRDHVIVRY